MSEEELEICLLEEAFALAGGPFTRLRTYVDAYVNFHYMSFLQLYAACDAQQAEAQAGAQTEAQAEAQAAQAAASSTQAATNASVQAAVESYAPLAPPARGRRREDSSGLPASDVA